MNERLKKLIAARAKAYTRAQELNTASDDKPLEGEALAEFERCCAEVDEIDTKIDQLEREAQMAARGDRRIEEAAGSTDRDVDEVRDDRAMQRACFTAWARGGMRALTDEQREYMAQRQANLPQGALETGTDTAGGFTVPEDFHEQLEEALLHVGGVRAAGATVMRMTNGRDLPMPTVNDTTQEGERLAENAPITEGDPSFGNVTLKAYIYSSKLVRVPITLLQDSAFDLGSWLATAFGTRIGRGQNRDFTSADGVSKPRGIVLDAAAGPTIGATIADISYDTFIDLEHAVDPEYRMNGRFMLHDDALKEARKIKDLDGRPIWQVGMTVGAPSTINGKPYAINQHLEDGSGSAEAPLLFGDMSKYHIREVNDVVTTRLVERYAEFLQVGFFAFQRADGALLDAGTAPIAKAVTA